MKGDIIRGKVWEYVDGDIYFDLVDMDFEKVIKKFQSYQKKYKDREGRLYIKGEGDYDNYSVDLFFIRELTEEEKVRRTTKEERIAAINTQKRNLREKIKQARIEIKRLDEGID